MSQGLGLALLMVVAATASDARALEPDEAESRPSMAPLLPVRIGGHAALTWEGEFGVGGRVDIPLIEQGVLFSTRDELAVSVGMDVVFVAFEGSDPLTFWPTGTVQWTLGLTPSFSFYPELGLAAQIERDGIEAILPNIGFGGRYHIWRSVAATGRLGWPMAISLGACF
jgi:hypothetical protein